jgi:hypothetical protein
MLLLEFGLPPFAGKKRVCKSTIPEMAQNGQRWPRFVLFLAGPLGRRVRGKMLYVDLPSLNYNPPEFIGLLGLGLSGSHCLGIGTKLISPGPSPVRHSWEEFHSRVGEATKGCEIAMD